MTLPTSPTRRIWAGVLILAAGFLLWMNYARIQRVNYVTDIARGGARVTAASPTGYASGARELIVGEHLGASFAWIAQTQQMLAGSEWRVRQIEYENVPYGRDVQAASPYRWWLGLIAGVDHALSGRPLGLAVERAALAADPLLHLLLLVALTVFAARQFGAGPAAWLALGVTFLFPFAAGFLPGVPDDFALVLALAPGSGLLLLVGLKSSLAAERGSIPAAAPAPRWVRGWFALAGLVGGLALWINVAAQVPLLLGIVLGALLAAWVRRAAATDHPAGGSPLALWRAWALGGAATVLVAYLVEYFPAALGGWELRVIHPLYGLAWLGTGELLGRTTAWIQLGKPAWRWPDLTSVILAGAAVAAVPVLMWKMGNPGFLAVDVLAFRLTKQADGIMAPSSTAWLSGSGMSAAAWATLVPVSFLVVAGWLGLRRKTAALDRASLALAFGPALVALGLAFLYLRGWQLLGGVLLPLLLAVTVTLGRDGALRAARWSWAALAGAALLAGIFPLIAGGGSAATNVLTVPEVEGLVERDLAQWLAQHTAIPGGPVVLAPPGVSAALYFYGGLRGLGSVAWENKDGLLVAIRIAISNSRDEALVLLRQRGVTHIVIPSWDDFFENYKHSASIQSGELFFVGLDRWSLPPWLRPVPYQLPGIAGFESQSVRIFEVVDEQDEPVAASRLAEYFIEMGQLENAKIAGQALRRYPADFGTLVARAQLEAALTDAEAFTAVFTPLLQRLAGGADRGLLWDRRVSLAVVLARGKKMELARVQVQRCLAELTEARLRTLTTNSLYHLLVLNKALGLEIADVRLRALALALLPVEVRARL